MRWSKLELLRASEHTITFDDSLSFDASAFSAMNQIRGLNDVRVSGKLRYDSDEDRVFADIEISGTMILPCAVHEAKGDVVELLPVIFQLILMEIPLKVVKNEVTYPKGNGWEVMKESDYQKQKKDEIDPRLAKLMEFKAEED